MVRAYLDYNATAPVLPEVRDAVCAALGIAGNPSSVHADGRAAHRAMERAREAVAALVGAAPSLVVFTSGGTESNNLALSSFPGRPRMVSAIEHDSVLQPAEAGGAAPGGQGVVPVDGAGRVDLAALDARLAQAGAPALVSLMLVNNETGVIQPVAEAAALAHARGALLHCDAVQAAGRLPIDMAALGADLLTLSAHKLGGPKGVGALVLREGVELPPLLRGGGQERRRRAGTENLPGIAGFGAAAALAGRLLSDQPRQAALRDGLESRLRTEVPDLAVHGAAAPRVANTACIGMPGVPAETQIMAFDLAGISVSSGAACSSGKVKPSHVLTAMGVGPERAAEAIRVSLGPDTTEEEIDRFAAAWTGLYRRRNAA